MSCNSGCSCGKVSACALGFAIGITWALGTIVLGLLAWRFHHGVEMVTALGSVYIGYAGTPVGIGLGALWGFVDGFVGGLIIGLVYNFWIKHCCCKWCKKTGHCEKHCDHEHKSEVKPS